MATYNRTGTTVTSGVPSPVGVPHVGPGRVYVLHNTVDLTGDAMTAADIYQVLPIPVGTQVLMVKLKILTAAVGTTCTIDVGVGGDNTWDDAINGKTEGWNHSVDGTDSKQPSTGASGVGGVFVSTADTIDVTMEAITAITAGPKFTLFAMCVDFNAV